MTPYPLAIAAWILADQSKPLNPPPEVRALGDIRSADNLLAASRALLVTLAKRYRPTVYTWCNVFLADVLAILRAPLPHVFDLGDGHGLRELRANDIVDGLRAGKFPGWSAVLSRLEPSNRAALGLVTIAVWKNTTPGGHGHVALVVPTPAGKSGIYVTAAGRTCADQCPIGNQFGTLPVEFYGYER